MRCFHAGNAILLSGPFGVKYLQPFGLAISKRQAAGIQVFFSGINRKLTSIFYFVRFTALLTIRAMRETLELPSFRVIRYRTGVLLLSALFPVIWISASGCSIKTKIKVDVPQGIRQAKTASHEELLEILRRYDKVNNLSCNEVELAFTSSQKIENGTSLELDKYKAVGGYILLKRPDSVHLVIKAPIVNSTLLDVVSVGDDFSVWSPRENRLYAGKNSARELMMEGPSGEKDFAVPIRGSHIFEAILPQSIVPDAPDTWVVREQQVDGRSSYYVLSIQKEVKWPIMRTIRKIWIERSGLTIARQQVFGDQDEVVSDIRYFDEVRKEGLSLPKRIQIDRPLDKYTLDLRFTDWKVNSPDLPEDAFELPPLPPNAEVVHLKEK